VSWQVQDAKQRFSELVQRAIDEGPQVVTRRGKDAVVVVAADEYQRLVGGATREFKAFLLSGPDLSQLDLESEVRDLPRETDL
jgi:prevent-host-death family protein